MAVFASLQSFDVIFTLRRKTKSSMQRSYESMTSFLLSTGEFMVHFVQLSGKRN